jgi:hypothetical protein
MLLLPQPLSLGITGMYYHERLRVLNIELCFFLGRGTNPENSFLVFVVYFLFSIRKYYFLYILFLLLSFSEDYLFHSL